MANVEIKVAALRAGVRHYEIADKIGIAPESFSRKLRKELSESEKQMILCVIDGLARGVN